MNSSAALALAPTDAVELFDAEAWAARTARPGDRFDAARAAHAEHFFVRYLRHTRGKLAGRPFILLPWQRSLVRAAFGWLRADGKRRFRTIYLRIGRKNGKTTLAAGFALYLAFLSGEAGAEVYCAAGDRDQAMICFDEAKRMRSQVQWFLKETEAFKHTIIRAASGDRLMAISAEEETKHGLNASGLILDEFHVWKGRGFFDVLHTSQAAREEPLEVITTTAGIDRESICWEIDQRALAILAGTIDDPEFLPVIFEAGAEDPIDDPATWAKANPSLGHGVTLDFLAKEAARALQSPSYENTFRRLHLNQWTEQVTRWLPLDAWDACADPVDAESLEGRECFGGLDLSTTTDLTALVLLFPPAAEGERWAILPFFWMPAETLRRRAEQDRVPFDVWSREGLIEATEGNVVDYQVIQARVIELAQRYRIREIAYDRWNASAIVTQLVNDGATMVPIGQGFQSMSGPSKEFERLVMSAAFAHGGHKVLRWMARNVALRQDPAGNIKPAKDKSTGRIDGIVAAIMALARATAGPKMLDLSRIESLAVI